MGLKNSKDDYYIHVLLIIGIYLFAGVNLILGTPCGDEAKKINYPMVNFCSDADVTITAVNIVVDGYSLSTSSAVKSCTCVARATLEKASELVFKNILISSPLHDDDCKSKVVFNQDPSNENSQSCLINGSMTFDVTKDIEITLIKETRSADTKYCFYIGLDQSNELQITCNQTFLWMNSSTENHMEGTTLQNTDNFEILERSEPPNHSTTAHQEISTQTDTLTFDDTDSLRNNDEESPKILYIFIGSGFGGALLFVIIVICLIKKIRRKKHSNTETDQPEEMNDDYGLQYNTLYMSSGDDCVQHTVTIRQDEYGEKVNQVAFPVEGNYSEIDLEKMPKKTTNKMSVSLMKETYIIREDAYSDIELDEQVLPSMSSKTDTLSESKCLSGTGNETFVVDSDSKNERDNSTSVRHVVSPGDDGFEYAVVDKPKSDNSRNDVYAVVHKTRKKNI